jgi:hypothetical protein
MFSSSVIHAVSPTITTCTSVSTNWMYAVLRKMASHDVATFAYPYGRSWDYNEDTLAVLRELGLRSAITAMPGLNDVSTGRLELRRIAVSEAVPLAEILCEVDGVFDWFARRGLDLRS